MQLQTFQMQGKIYIFTPKTAAIIKYTLVGWFYLLTCEYNKYANLLLEKAAWITLFLFL